jgi:hypothetical protein
MPSPLPPDWTNHQKVPELQATRNAIGQPLQLPGMIGVDFLSSNIETAADGRDSAANLLLFSLFFQNVQPVSHHAC